MNECIAKKISIIFFFGKFAFHAGAGTLDCVGRIVVESTTVRSKDLMKHKEPLNPAEFAAIELPIANARTLSRRIFYDRSVF